VSSGSAGDESLRPPEGERDESDIRTFLIADVRGYTRFTQEHGDEEAGSLAARFAELAREAVDQCGGTLLELRGDEALCVFTSARRALRAAVDLQVRSRTSVDGEPPFALGIGVGLDAGEAVPIEGGYRGKALNLAARLCALAGPGEILATETVVGLAGRLEGVRFIPRRPVRLKGIEQPVRMTAIAPAEALPPLPSPVRKRTLDPRWLVVATVGAIALIGALVALGISRATEEQWLEGVQADAVGLIDADAGHIAAQLPVGDDPRSLAVGDGSVWVANGLDDTVSRIDPATHDVHTIPVGQSPTAIAFGGGSLWVANDQDRTVSRISAEENRVVQTIPVGNGPRAIAFGGGAVWVANGVDSTLSRVDPNKVSAPMTIPVGLNPSGIAVLDGSVWVTSEGTATVSRLDAASGDVQATVSVGNGPSAIAAGEGVLWITNAQDGTVSRLDPAQEKVTGAVSVGRNPRAIAAGLGAVWVANADAGTVSRIDPETPEVDSTIRLVGSPTALAVAGDSVWATAVSAPASHRGGRLRIEYGDQVWFCECFDPHVPWQIDAWALLTGVFDGLVTYKRVGGTEGGTVVPDLAISVPRPSDDGKTYTFRLRPGLRFSNGRPVRASDVSASLERMVRLSLGWFLYQGIVGAPACNEQPDRCDLSEGVEVDDESGSVVIHLSEPDPDFLAKLALPFASVLPADSPRNQDNGLHLIGTGPYKLAAFDPGGLRLVRNESFRVWSRDARPAGYPDEIDVRFGAGDTERLEAVSSGDADYTGLTWGTDLSPAELSELAARYAGQLQTDPNAIIQYVLLRTTEAPFDDVLVRRALNYAVDRRAVQDLLGGPLGARLTCQMLPPNLPGYEPYCPYTLDPNPAGTWSAPDVARATRLVARSGTKHMRVQMAVDTHREAIGRYFVRLLRVLGYRAGLTVIDDDEEYYHLIVDHERRVQLAATGWQGDYIAPANFLQVNFACPALLDGLLNDSEFCDPKIDALMRRAARAQADDSARALALWAKADRALTDAAPAVFLANPRFIALVSERVGNYQVHPVWGPLLDQLWVE
jgi:YVTN family beta-propeller protein